MRRAFREDGENSEREKSEVLTESFSSGLNLVFPPLLSPQTDAASCLLITSAHLASLPAVTKQQEAAE